MCSVRLYPIKAFKRLGTPTDCGHVVPRGALLFLAGNGTVWCSRECFAVAEVKEPVTEPAKVSA